MTNSPTITLTQPQHTAVIRLTVPREQIGDVMGPGISEVLAAVAAHGMAPAGPWFSRHFQAEDEMSDFEIGVPVEAPVTALGRVRPGSLPGGRVARTIHRGGYESLVETWDALDAWIAASGHVPEQNLWERYLVGPESSLDPAAWCTELNQPLAD